MLDTLDEDRENPWPFMVVCLVMLVGLIGFRWFDSVRHEKVVTVVQQEWRCTTSLYQTGDPVTMIAGGNLTLMPSGKAEVVPVQIVSSPGSSIKLESKTMSGNGSSYRCPELDRMKAPEENLVREIVFIITLTNSDGIRCQHEISSWQDEDYAEQVKSFAVGSEWTIRYEDGVCSSLELKT